MDEDEIKPVPMRVFLKDGTVAIHTVWCNTKTGTMSCAFSNHGSLTVTCVGHEFFVYAAGSWVSAHVDGINSDINRRNMEEENARLMAGTFH